MPACQPGKALNKQPLSVESPCRLAGTVHWVMVLTDPPDITGRRGGHVHPLKCPVGIEFSEQGPQGAQFWAVGLDGLGGLAWNSGGVRYLLWYLIK